MQKIFIFGDSIAYGAWDPAGGWVERLRQWLFVTTRDEYNLGTFLYNLSIVGDTTADLLKQFTTWFGGAPARGYYLFYAAAHQRAHRLRPADGDARCSVHQCPDAYLACPGVCAPPLLGRAHASG